MSRTFVKHIAGPYNEQTMLQNCIICGTEVSNYQNAMWPNGQKPPTGFPEGIIYISDGNPRITATTLTPSEEEGLEDCSVKK